MSADFRVNVPLVGESHPPDRASFIQTHWGYSFLFLGLVSWGGVANVSLLCSRGYEALYIPLDFREARKDKQVCREQK